MINTRYTTTYSVIAVFGFATLLLSALYWPTVMAMTSTWAGSETYSHCFLVIPAFLYFVWDKRSGLTGPLSPSPGFAIPLCAFGFLWLLGSLAEVALITQAAFMGMLVSLTAGLTGVAIARQLAFPLLFLFLAVPVGDELLPIMMEHTADVTVAVLRLLGFAVFREGNHFTMPSGNWSVVEACSGVRYLIASVAVGLVYAYMTYRSFYRRALFMLAAIIVPVVANWLRAILIVLLGHYSGLTIATGVDHLVYGWLFFGLVIFVMFWLGSFWREDDPVSKVAGDQRTYLINTGVWNRSAWPWGLFLLILVMVWPAWNAWSQDRLSGVEPKNEPVISAGYHLCPSCEMSLTPAFDDADHYVKQSFVGPDNEVVHLFIATYYSWGSQGEVISYKNQFVLSGDKTNRVVGRSTTPWSFITQIKTRGAVDILALDWYQVNGQPESNPVKVKIKEAMLKLTGQAFLSQYVVVFTPSDDSGKAESHLHRFLQSNLTALEAFSTTDDRLQQMSN